MHASTVARLGNGTSDVAHIHAKHACHALMSRI